MPNEQPRRNVSRRAHIKHHPDRFGEIAPWRVYMEVRWFDSLRRPAMRWYYSGFRAFEDRKCAQRWAYDWLHGASTFAVPVEED